MTRELLRGRPDKSGLPRDPSPDFRLGQDDALCHLDFDIWIFIGNWILGIGNFLRFYVFVFIFLSLIFHFERSDLFDGFNPINNFLYSGIVIILHINKPVSVLKLRKVMTKFI